MMTLRGVETGCCLALAAALSSVACGPRDGFEKPEAPDMSDLVSRYDNPSAELTEETGTGLLDDAEALLARIEATGLPELVEGAVNETIERLEEGDLGQEQTARWEPARVPQAVEGFSGDAAIHVTRICPGWEEPTPDAEKNGYLEVTATLSEAGLDPVVWGTVSACQLLVMDSEIELNASSDEGALRVHFGLPADGGAARGDPLTFDVDLSVSVDGQTETLDLDFRYYVAAQAFEFLLPRGQQEIAVRIAANGSVVIRADNGDFTCDVAALSCVNENGQSAPLN